MNPVPWSAYVAPGLVVAALLAMVGYGAYYVGTHTYDPDMYPNRRRRRFARR